MGLDECVNTWSINLYIKIKIYHCILCFVKTYLVKFENKVKAVC